MVLALVAASAFSLSVLAGERAVQYPTVMVKRWDAASEMKGKAFWARFQSSAHGAIAARHLNAAKASGQFADDFGVGDYHFACPR